MKTTISFLSDLKNNNNREWFAENKSRYEAAKAETEALVASVIREISLFDASLKFIEPKDTLFRIYRDTRFSHNKEPYKNNMGAWMCRNGRKSPGPGYYLHIEPGESFLAGGIYMPEPQLLKSIRTLIFENTEAFEKILSDKNFRKYFKGLMEQDKIKRPPKDFPADFPGIEWLKYKHYVVSTNLDDAKILDKDFVKHAGKVYKTVYPFNQFLSQA